MKLNIVSFSLLSTVLFLALLLLLTGAPKIGAAITADDLKKQLTSQELEQAGGELEEQFATHEHEHEHDTGEDEEKLSYFRLSLAGKHQQLMKNAVLMAVLATLFLIIRAATAAK